MSSIAVANWRMARLPRYSRYRATVSRSKLKMSKKVCMFAGKVVRNNSLWKAARVRVYKMKFDTHLNMYFNTRHHYWAADPQEEAKEGDIVLIKSLDEPYDSQRRVTYSIKEKIFPVGNITDPITGERCRGIEIMDTAARHFRPLEAIETSQLKTDKNNKETMK